LSGTEFADLSTKLRSQASRLGTTRIGSPDQKGDKRMQTYISLLKLTEQGIKNIKDAPARVEQAIKAIEAGGGKFIGFYVVMGEYDYVVIAESPSDEVMTTYLLRLRSLGNVKTTTMTALANINSAI
jgi:uncharacterized protein with GYD domain